MAYTVWADLKTPNLGGPRGLTPRPADWDQLIEWQSSWPEDVSANNKALSALASLGLRVAALPAGSEGMVAYDEATHSLRYCNNVGWRGLGQTPFAQDVDGAGYALSGLGHLTLANGKIFSAPGQTRCRAYASGVTSIPNAVWTAIALAGESFDIGDMHNNAVNNTRITIPAGAGGPFLLVGRVTFAAHATGYRQADVRKGGNTYLGGSPSVAAHPSLPQHATFATIAELAAGDYLELMAYQDCGAPLNTYMDYSFLAAYKLA